MSDLHRNLDFAGAGKQKAAPALRKANLTKRELRAMSTWDAALLDKLADDMDADLRRWLIKERKLILICRFLWPVAVLFVFALMIAIAQIRDAACPGSWTFLCF